MARDTEDDWKLIGQSEPWYGVLSAPKFLSASITEQAKTEFYDQGVTEIEWVVSTIRADDPGFAPKNALDFGSGLGRLSFAMASTCENVIGVDISPGMRAEADRQKVERGVRNVQFSETFPAGQSFDWINSYIVLQHVVPSKGYEIVRSLVNALAPGGWTSIQLPFAHDHRDLTSIQRDTYAYSYDGETAVALEFNETPVGQMSMYDYNLNRILFSFVRAGIANIRLIHTDHGGVHGFWIFAKK
jgi:SAM-dependent methyltransferase